MVWYTRRICLPSTILSTHDRGAFALIPQSVLTAASYHLTQVSTRVKVQINKKKLPVNSFIFQRKKKTGKPACDSNSYALHLGVTEKANRSSIHVLYHQSIFSYPWINGVEFSNYRHKAGRQRQADQRHVMDSETPLKKYKTRLYSEINPSDGAPNYPSTTSLY